MEKVIDNYTIYLNEDNQVHIKCDTGAQFPSNHLALPRVTASSCLCFASVCLHPVCEPLYLAACRLPVRATIYLSICERVRLRVVIRSRGCL